MSSAAPLSHNPTPAGTSDPIDLAADHWAANGWSEAVDGMVVVTSVMRAQQLLLGHIEQELREFGLTFARFELLRLLAFSRTGSLPIGKIGERLQVHAASATSAVGRLERDGDVVRSVNKNDRRSVLVTISPAGRERVEAATARLNEQVFSQLPVSPSTQSDLIEGLRALRRGYD